LFTIIGIFFDKVDAKNSKLSLNEQMSIILKQLKLRSNIIL